MTTIDARTVLTIDDASAYATRSARLAVMRAPRGIDMADADDIAQDAIIAALAEDPAYGMTREYIGSAVATILRGMVRDYARAHRIAGTDDAPDGAYADIDIDTAVRGTDGGSYADMIPDAGPGYQTDADALAADADALQTRRMPDGRTYTADPGWCPADIAASGIAIPALRTAYQYGQTPVRGGAENTGRMIAATLSDRDAHILATLDRPAGSHAECCGMAAGAVRIARGRARARAAGGAGADYAPGGNGGSFSAAH